MIPGPQKLAATCSAALGGSRVEHAGKPRSQAASRMQQNYRLNNGKV